MRSSIFVAFVMAVAIVVLFGILCRGEKEFVVEYFPAKVGNWWEYEYRYLVIEYDTVANDTLELLYVDSLHDEIIGTDTMAGWFCYKFHETLYDYTRWFAHMDSALLLIAALSDTNPASVALSPSNVTYVLHSALFRTVSDLFAHLRIVTDRLYWNLAADTVYFVPPQKYYVYPMSIGTEWVKMTEPWYEQREAVAAESVTVPAGTFHTLRLRVESDSGIEYERYIWISEEGMIRDSMYARGVAINTVGDTVGYFDVYTIYDLLSLRIE